MKIGMINPIFNVGIDPETASYISLLEQAVGYQAEVNRAKDQTIGDLNQVIAKKDQTIQGMADIIQKQNETIQDLKNEVARAKGINPKPQIRPSKLETPKEKTEKEGEKEGGKRPGSAKKMKTKDLTIHNEIVIAPDHIPEGAVLKDYKTFVVQDILLEANNTLYKLPRYVTPDGKTICGKLPDSLNGKHYGPNLTRFILYQYHNCQVTEPLLLEELREIGIELSTGQLNNILIEDKEDFHEEKEELLEVGLEISDFVNVDDTGARHMGKNGYCNHIGNEFFAHFESTESKSRINFLKLLQAGERAYYLNDEALEYLEATSLPKKMYKLVKENIGNLCTDDSTWEAFLNEKGITIGNHRRLITEGALMGGLLANGLSRALVIVSDDAGQFKVVLLKHMLCWVHAERNIKKLEPVTDGAKEDYEKVQKDFWAIYERLKEYKENPTLDEKLKIIESFDELCLTKTRFASLNLALKQLYKNKDELLLVLERPELPLHNNLSERDIREYVKRRKISGSTRSENGRRCRDTFASLKKTCRKLGISFWDYLRDRLVKGTEVPRLTDVMRKKRLQQSG